MLSTSVTREKNGERILALSAADLAQRLGVSLRHVRRLDSVGKVPKPLRLGRSIRWRMAEIQAWLEAGAPDRKSWQAMKGGQHD